MKVSANEVLTLAIKAARGGGAPPAQAADFGRAALRHLQAQRDPASLSAALDTLPEGPILSLPLHIARLIEAGDALHPQGALPFMESAQLIESYAQSQVFAAETSRAGDKLNVTFHLETPNPAPTAPRVILPDTLAHQMQTLAAKTLVPETDASRLSGAGAGLTDND